MATITGMRYGIPFSTCERIPTQVGVEWSYETSEFYHGTTLIRLHNDSVCTINYETEDTQSSGLKPALGGSNNLAQVQLQVQEETNTILKLPRYAGQEITDSDRLLRACQQATRYLALRKTLTVSGKGIQVWDETKQGTLIGAMSLQAASGPFTITIPATMRIEKVGRTQTNSGDPHTWNGEGFAYEANTGNQSQNMITLPSEVTALLPSPAVKVIQETQTMAGDLKTNVKRTFQVTCHLAS